jgi:hypothetical protein
MKEEKKIENVKHKGNRHRDMNMDKEKLNVRRGNHANVGNKAKNICVVRIVR